MKYWLALCALWWFVAISSSSAQAAPSPLPPKPDFSAMSFLLGTWSCSHVSSRRRTPTLYTESWRLDSSGYWMNETIRVKPRPSFPHATIGTDRFTYDPEVKRWISVYTDNFGSYDLAVSQGWRNGKVVWVSSAPLGPGLAKATEDLTRMVGRTKTVRTWGFITKTGAKISITQTCLKTT